jgi:hypothetical protein
MLSPSWFHLCRDLVGIATPTIVPAPTSAAADDAGASDAASDDAGAADGSGAAEDAGGAADGSTEAAGVAAQPANAITSMAHAKTNTINFFPIKDSSYLLITYILFLDAFSMNR